MFHRSLLVWPNESNPWNFAKEFRVRVANKVINKLAITWFRTERFLGLSLSSWAFTSAYPFAALNFHTNDISYAHPSWCLDNWSKFCNYSVRVNYSFGKDRYTYILIQIVHSYQT